jgi:hypothetical protein
MIQYIFILYLIITSIFVLIKRYSMALLWPYIICICVITPILILIYKYNNCTNSTTNNELNSCID